MKGWSEDCIVLVGMHSAREGGREREREGEREVGREGR